MLNKLAITTNEKLLVLLFIALKIAVLLFIPLTGDEAYFITWGRDVSLGYYDHPPVVGWVIYLLSFISEHHYLYRFFAFCSAAIVALLMYKLVAEYKGRQIALYVALLFFVSPISLLAVLLTNDIVLFLFGFVGFYFFSKALSKNSIMLMLLAAVFLGLAFLSKYFSVLMFFGLLLYLAISWQKVNWKVAVAGIVIVLLFVAENLYFNINNCWNNVVFNTVSRTKENEMGWTHVAIFFVTFLVLVPPYAVYLFRKVDVKNPPEFIVQAKAIAAVFLGCFLLVSLYHGIGLHWFILCLPFVYLLLSNFLVEKLQTLLKYNIVISALIALVLIVISTQYDTFFSKHKKYRDVLFYTETSNICQQLPHNETIFTLGYSKNSVLAYHCKNNDFHVILNTSKYGREDDKKINYAKFDGKSLTLFLMKQDSVAEASEYFDSVEVSPIIANRDINYYLMKGAGFNYKKYKQDVIETIAERYYSPPDWFPKAQCEFKNKYAL